MHKVVVTGLGVVSPLGNTITTFWAALNEGASHPVKLDLPEAYMANRLFYLLADPEGDASSGPDTVAGLAGRASRIACRAAARALEDAGFNPAGNPRVGLAVGTGMGEMEQWEQQRLAGSPQSATSAYVFRVGSDVAEAFDVQGPNMSCANACAASAYAVALGTEAIQDGRADVMIVGGSEVTSRVGLGCFNRLGAVDSEVCRPFDAHREGTLLGEGAAFLVLESEAHAKARGVKHFYAAIEGAGWSCDGHHATAPEATGAATERALRNALAEAALQPDQIDCVLAHGTGTGLNDLRESELLARVFGAHVAEMPVTSPKGKLGHSGGAAGAFSCLIGALVVEHGKVPPIGNLKEADPACHVSLVKDQSSLKAVDHLLVNAYGFGGNNISIVLGGAHA